MSPRARRWVILLVVVLAFVGEGVMLVWVFAISS